MDEERLLKCLVDNNRRRILQCLGNEELCVNDIIERTGLEQTLVSFHLKRLKSCGLVQNHREGKKIFYSRTKSEIGDVLELINKLSTDLKDCCEDDDVCK
jgi:DNA-binding transcriptional ArsR family regulator